MEPMKILITGANRYKFKNDQGEQIEGTNVHFLQLNDEKTENNLGYLPAKQSFSYDYFENMEDMPSFPFLAEAGITIKFSGKRPSIRIQSIQPIESIDLNG